MRNLLSNAKYWMKKLSDTHLSRIELSELFKQLRHEACGINKVEARTIYNFHDKSKLELSNCGVLHVSYEVN